MADQSRVAIYDMLRGMAIVGVIWSHVSQSMPSGVGVWDFAQGLGRFGVQLFFLVSAMTMCLMWERRTQEHHRTRNFYIRRFLRIAPLFWLAMVIYAQPSQTWHQIVPTALFVHSLVPDAVNVVVPGGWSISVEMLFYLVFPLVMGRLAGNSAACVALGMVLYALNAVVIRPVTMDVMGDCLGACQTDQREFLYMTFPQQLPVFFLGLALFWVRRDGRGLWMFGLLAVWGAVAAGRIALGWHPEMERMTLVTLGLFLLVFNAEHLAKLPGSGMLAALGKVSYGMYLSHFLVIAGLVQAGTALGLPLVGLAGNGLAMAMVTAVTYGVALVIYRLVETPGHRLTEYVVARFERA